MVLRERCCLGLYHQAINDSSKSCKVNSRAYLEDRMSSIVATRDKEGWHCVSKMEYLSLITQRKTSPQGRDEMGTRWKVYEPETQAPQTGRI